MNFPTGVTKILGKPVKSVDARPFLEELCQTAFSGYTVESLFGMGGVEESALVFRSGKVVGSVYEYHSSHQTLSGDESIPHVLNAFLSESGILDVVELSNQQVDLVLAFTAVLRLAKPLDKTSFRSLFPSAYNPRLGETISSHAQQSVFSTKESLFKRFGLNGIEGK